MIIVSKVLKIKDMVQGVTYDTSDAVMGTNGE
jgi:hypothetical protein